MTEVKNCRIQPKMNIYKPLFHQIFKTSKQRSSKHTVQRVLRKYYMLKTYSKPLHLLLTSNFPYILNNDQSKYSKPCWNCANERKSQKFACDSTTESTKEGLICSVREEPNSVQPCQFRFLTNHCQARAANPRKQPEKLGWDIRGVFGRVEKRFPGPEKFTRKEPRKVYGPEKFSGLLRNARLAGDIVLCSWARQLTLSAQVHKWVPANLMLGLTLRWTSIPSRGK